MKNNLHVFLGATVADPAARPLHWGYNQKKLLTYIKGKKDFTFLKKNKSPFYNIKTGKVSGYNEVGQVMLKTLVEGHENIEERFKKNITRNFGPGSVYWKNLNLRAKYKKVKDWRGIIKGPWIHQNIIESVKNIKAKKDKKGYPEADKVMKNGILIACHHGLTKKMINHIHNSIDDFLLKYN